MGVLADPKIDGVKTPVLPTVYVYNPDGNYDFSVRFMAAQIADGTFSYRQYLAVVRSTDAAFRRYFLERHLRQPVQVGRESRVQMFGLFVGIAIFIACLGLFGLAAFTAERRTKEIGMRKVFGARTRDIVRLLLWQFSIPVLIANVIAWPVA